MNATLQVLKERGFFSQCTDVDGLSALMDAGPVTFYEGTDPTGPSLHIGHMVPYFAFRHMLAAGHRGISLLGGGTARIGDPSGKTEMRQMLSYETLDANVESLKKQLTSFMLSTSSGSDKNSKVMDNVIFEDNKNWLADLNYIDFLREIGSHFSVNRMLTFESYKKRLETGLSFLEFNYQLLQSYDFLQLYRRYGCRLQIGGDDQWGNIVAGADLIRRIEGLEGKKPEECQVYGLTFPLITRSDGKKMGKSEKGAVFVDKTKTSVYDFFQYWRNITDADLKKFFLIFTFLPIDEIEAICAPGKNPNEGKERLAWEVTSLIHGKDEADKAMAGAKAAFGGGSDGVAADKNAMPTVPLAKSRFDEGINITDLFYEAKLCATKSDARRLVEQGGASVNGTALSDVKALIKKDMLDADGELILKAGKKRFSRIVLQ
ncbi:MAG: tyrosine--tRNA ligase [Spirochaetaceae bacterium]|jgi:tyrosyl-tRNA synthetase|nr:tyrosine--tRNA ligase [Spirochaetaceae bacterium]